MSKQHKLKSVEHYGEVYVQQYLAEARERHQAITSDLLDALAFMYGKVFMRRRRDAISVTFKNRTLEVLQRYKTLQDIEPNSLEDSSINRRVNNRHDRLMVKQTISFVSHDLQEYGCNVFNWAANLVRNRRNAEAYTALTGIHAIGDKLATFYLRDVVLLEGMEDSIRADDYVYFQLIDTWVEQVARSFDITDEGDRGRISVIMDKIIHDCFAVAVSPLLFNAGAWMVGANAYRLLLERL